jgi:AraC-like DNA-binding protein
MGMRVTEGNERRLERSCGPSPRDWLRSAPQQPGLERIEAYFTGHAYDPHRHDTYAIGFTVSGVQCFDYRGEVVRSTPGNAIVLHPDEVHNGRAGAAGGFRYRMLYVEPRLIQAALGERGPLPFVRTAVNADARLLAALHGALDDLATTLEPLAEDQVVLALADALLSLDPSAAARPHRAACGRAVERARSFLDAHHDRVVTAGELEAASGLDRYTLARQFRARLGTSPYRYLLMRRLDHARALLRRGHALADTAAACGFADQSHMTRCFTRAFGLSPGRWRAMQRAGGESQASG